MSALLATTFTSQAYDFEVDGICYNYNNDGISVAVAGEYVENDTIYQYPYSGDVIIPSSVAYNGKTYSVTAIGDQAFNDCKELLSVSIPNSVTSLGVNAFYNCTGLTSIIIPNSVTSIDMYAFAWCTGLTSVTMSNAVTTISEAAFWSCTSLTSINIPSSVTSIGEAAFMNCTSLTNLPLPNSLTSIGGYSFALCKGLTSLNIPNSVTFIGDLAFNGCISLTNIVIPNSVISNFSTNSAGLFYQCSGLTSVTIGSGITWMGITFFDCPNITRVTCLSTTPPYAQPYRVDGKTAYIFSPEIFDFATLYVPDESVEAYKNHPYWKQFNTILPISEFIGPRDPNGDGEVNIGDINTIINIILGGTDNSQGRADVNNDAEVNIADINAVIDAILM